MGGELSSTFVYMHYSLLIISPMFVDQTYKLDLPTTAPSVRPERDGSGDGHCAVIIATPRATISLILGWIYAEWKDGWSCGVAICGYSFTSCVCGTEMTD